MTSTEDEGLRQVYLCYIQLANALEKTQRQEQAGEILRFAVERYPSAPSLNFALGRWQLTEAATKADNNTQIDESVRRFSLAIKYSVNEDPVLGLAYEHLGLAYRLQEKYEESINALQEAKSRGQNSLILWVALGDCLSRNGPGQNLPNALLVLNNALEIDPASVDALRFKARVLREMKEFDQALQYYDSALKGDPCNVLVLTGRAECLKMLGKPERALKDLDAALRLRPDFSLALVRRAGAKMMLHRYQDALKDLCLVVDGQSNSPGALASRGLLYQYLREYKLSLSDLDLAIAKKAYPLPLVLTYRGETHRLKGDIDKALADFNHALSEDKTCVAGHIGRAECYYQLEDYAEAIKEFSRALEVEQHRGINQYFGEYKVPLSDFDAAIKERDYLLIWVLIYRGEAYRLKGEIDKALSDFDRAVSLDKQCLAGYAGRAECYYQKEEYTKALEDFSMVLDIKRDTPGALLRRAHIWYRLGDHKSCLSDLEKVGSSPIGQMIRGRSLVDLGLFEEALRYFDLALEEDNSLVVAIVWRAEVLIRLGRYRESLAELEKALKRKPLTDWILYDKAITFRKLGLADQERNALLEAIAIAEEKTSVRPDSFRDAFNLALYYLVSSDKTRALRAYHDVLKGDPPSWFVREACRDVNSYLSLFPDDILAPLATREILPNLRIG